MAQGRGNAFSIAMLLLLFLLGLHQASAVTHTVGGSKGWDVNIDYTSWAAGQTFTVGDILFFPFLAPEHNVVVVNKAGYDTCSAANAIATFSESNVNVTLNATGAHYYLCSVPGHCAAGMKLSVTVAKTAAAPLTPPPAKTPTPVKAPSARKTPSSAPAPASSAGKAPAPVPASSGTRASAPAPASSPTRTPSKRTPASSPGSSPSLSGTPPSTSSPPNSAPHLLASAALSPLLAFVSSLFLAFQIIF